MKTIFNHSFSKCHFHLCLVVAFLHLFNQVYFVYLSFKLPAAVKRRSEDSDIGGPVTVVIVVVAH